MYEVHPAPILASLYVGYEIKVDEDNVLAFSSEMRLHEPAAHSPSLSIFALPGLIHRQMRETRRQTDSGLRLERIRTTERPRGQRGLISLRRR